MYRLFRRCGCFFLIHGFLMLSACVRCLPAWLRRVLPLTSQSEFAKATGTYLGRVVGQGTVRPVEEKVKAVACFPVPTTKKELMRFLGLVGYYRSFCRNFSDVVAPLTDLLKASATFVWSPICQQAFEKVKSLLCNAPVLSAPRFDRPFALQVDASHVGVGAVLLQSDEFGIDKPVSFF